MRLFNWHVLIPLHHDRHKQSATTGWLSPVSLAHSFTFKPGAAEILTSLKENPGKKLTREEKKILKKEFYKQLKIYAKCKLTHDKEGGDKALLILLTIIVR